MSKDNSITDTERINFLAEIAKKSRTGMSIDFSNGRYRLSTFHNLGKFIKDIREAIDIEIAKDGI